MVRSIAGGAAAGPAVGPSKILGGGSLGAGLRDPGMAFAAALGLRDLAAAPGCHGLGAAAPPFACRASIEVNRFRTTWRNSSSDKRLISNSSTSPGSSICLIAAMVKSLQNLGRGFSSAEASMTLPTSAALASIFAILRGSLPSSPPPPPPPKSSLTPGSVSGVAAAWAELDRIERTNEGLPSCDENEGCVPHNGGCALMGFKSMCFYHMSL